MNPRWTKALSATLIASLVVVALSVTTPAHAEKDATAPASASASAPPSIWTLAIPLAPLPKLPSRKFPPVKKRASEQLASRLAQLGSLDVDDPLDDPNLDFLLEDVDDDLVVAIADRLESLRQTLSEKTVRRQLGRARRSGRKAIRRAKKKDGIEPEGDWLTFLLAGNEKQVEQRQSAIELFAMLRQLEKNGSMPAVRTMISAYSYFGEIVRIDLQRAMQRLGVKSIAALTEAKEHRAKRVRRWARKRLDVMGRAIPGEAVAIKDVGALANVLRAFGYNRQLDATRVLVSYASSERSQLRTAARQAIRAIGKPARWQLREAYQTHTGSRPPRSWSWDRTAQELFRIYEQATMKPILDQLKEGGLALERGDDEAATKAFDLVLQRMPTIAQGPQMGPAYRRHGEKLLAHGKGKEALAYLHKAHRLSKEAKEKKVIASTIATIEATRHENVGLADRYLLTQAAALDPTSARTRSLLRAREGNTEPSGWLSKPRMIAGASLLIGLLGFGLLFRRRDETAMVGGSAE